MTASGEARGALWPSLLPPDQHGRDDLTAVSATGVRITFADGRQLLDGTSGLWNVNLGYGNVAIADAVARALRHASYLSVFRYENEYAQQAAWALLGAAGAGRFERVLFSTSGGAANDLVMKLARHYQALRGASRRRLVVGLRGSYHGLTYGSFGLTGDDLGQQLYGVDQRLVRHVPPNDVDQLETLFARAGDQVAAVVVEPVLGSGAVALSRQYVEALVELRRKHGFVLVADEVATGFGRTGHFFASQQWPEPPDVLVTSKGLTNGTCAAAALLVGAEVAQTFQRNGAVLTHGETQAGTPPTCAAVLATVSEMDRLDALARGRHVSDGLDVALDALKADMPEVVEHRGRGCFRAVQVSRPDGSPLPQEDVPQLVASVRRAGAIVHPGPHGFQLVPALTYSDDELSELVLRVRTGVASFMTPDHARRVAL